VAPVLRVVAAVRVAAAVQAAAVAAVVNGLVFQT
jgi:hypothetical protein